MDSYSISRGGIPPRLIFIHMEKMRLLAALFHDELDFVRIDADHRLAETGGDFCENIGILPVCNSLHDCRRTLDGIATAEDAAPNGRGPGRRDGRKMLCMGGELGRVL